MIYRHFIPDRLRILVHGEAAQAVDPLFLMEHGRFYDDTPSRAERIQTRTFEVEAPSGAKGSVRIRASILPPDFQLGNPSDYRPDGRGVKTHPGRLDVMKKYNGLIVCRAGRQIDCISPEWTKFQNYDTNIKIEVDFDPTLDEYFSLTTAKQQIVVEDEMWEKLKHDGKNGGGLQKLVQDLRRRREELDEELAAKAENKAKNDVPRPSVAAMDETEKFKGALRDTPPEKKEQAERNLKEAAKERAEQTGKPEQLALDELTTETSNPRRKWEIKFAPVPEGPIYRPLRLGEQKQVILNTEHPFYGKVYQAAGDARYALEVMLLVLADRELDATGEAETFYKAERQRWSERLRHALNSLVSDESLQNKASAMAEMMHVAASN